MDGQAILTVSAAVVALTQLVKWSGLEDRYGPLAVLVLSMIGTAFWGFSEGTFERRVAFEYFAGWIAVSTSVDLLTALGRLSAKMVRGCT